MAAAVFRLINVHGHRLAIDRTSGHVVSIAAGAAMDVVELIGQVVGPDQGVVALTSAGDAPLLLRIDGPAPGQRVVFLRVHAIPASGLQAFTSPRTAFYMTSPPIEAGAPSYLVYIGSDAPKAWETFQAEPAPHYGLSAGAASRLAAAAGLAASAATAEALLAWVTQEADAAEYLAAGLPLVPTVVLDGAACRLMADAGARRQLAARFPADLWAEAALPALATWQNAREAGDYRRSWLDRLLSRPGAAKPAPATPPPPARQAIGPALDRLGPTGLDGASGSFPRACVLRARRTTVPSRRFAVLATARNEGVYLVEWVAYYRSLGADAVFLYSNDNEDGSDALLGALADAGEIHWVSSTLDARSGNAQQKAYGHALNFAPDLLDFEWVLIVDLDEFLVLDPVRHPDVQSFCALHSELGTDAVSINWQFVGSEEPGDVKQPLTGRNLRILGPGEMGDGIRHVKSMSRPNRISHSRPHIPVSDERGGLLTLHASGRQQSWHNPPPGFAPTREFTDKVEGGRAIINHYFHKSAAEWLWKCSRNRGDHALHVAGKPASISQEQAIEFMRQARTPTAVADSRAADRLPDVQQRAAAMREKVGVAGAEEDVRQAFATRMAVLRQGYRNRPDIDEWNTAAVAFLRLAGVELK